MFDKAPAGFYFQRRCVISPFPDLHIKACMKNKLMAIILIAGISFSCNPSKKASTNGPVNSNPNPDSSSAAVQKPADGKSFETAIVINKTTEKAGINAEYQWIREHFSNYHVVKQVLVYNDDKRFDVITIQLSDGSTQDIYFDITKFFGSGSSELLQ